MSVYRNQATVEPADQRVSLVDQFGEWFWDLDNNRPVWVFALVVLLLVGIGILLGGFVLSRSCGRTIVDVVSTTTRGQMVYVCRCGDDVSVEPHREPRRSTR